MGRITSEPLQLGVILDERVFEPSVPKLEGQASFECGLWEVTKNQLNDVVGTHETIMVLKSDSRPTSETVWEAEHV